MARQMKFIALVMLPGGVVYRTATVRRANASIPSWEDTKTIFGVKAADDWKTGSYPDLPSACRALGVRVAEVRSRPFPAGLLRIVVRPKRREVVNFDE